MASREGPLARSARRITTMMRGRRWPTHGTSAVGTPNSAASIRSWPMRITRWRSSVRAKRSSSTSRRRPRLRRRDGRAVWCSNFAAGARTWISTPSMVRPSSRYPERTPPLARGCIRASTPATPQDIDRNSLSRGQAAKISETLIWGQAATWRFANFRGLPPT